MKFNFRKIASVLASAVMIGSTLGIAAAANYPTPFVSNAGGDVAVVVGASAATSDYIAAGNVGSNLQAELAKLTATGGTSAGATASGGDSYKLEKTSTKFHLGNGMLDVVSGTVTNTNLPTLLKDGIYVDDDNDEFDYTQKITLGNVSLTMFDDNDYKSDTPTVGMKIATSEHVLNYTISFTDQPVWTDLTSTNLNLLGKSYFVLSTDAPTNTTMTLLDSAKTVTLAEGETQTVTIGDKTYEASIAFITTGEVKLTINGQTTNTLAAAQTQKLTDGAYVGVKTISVQNYAGGTKQVEFSIGSGKLKIVHGSDIEMNDNTVSRLKGYLNGNNTNKLTSIVLSWDADGDQFVATDKSPEMPGFKAIKLSFGGMTYPANEVITLEAGSDTNIVLKNFPLKDTTSDISLVWQNDSKNITGIGKDANNVLRTASGMASDGNITFDADTDSYFVASFADTSNSESYLMRAANFKVVSAVNKTTIQYRKGDTWTSIKEDAIATDTVSIGSVDLTIGLIDYDARTVIIKPTTATATNFNTLYSNTGLKVQLPYVNDTYMGNASAITGIDCASGYPAFPVGLLMNRVTNGTATTNGGANETAFVICYKTTYNVKFTERDKSGVVANGKTFNATIGYNAAATPQLSVTDILGESVAFAQEGSSKLWDSYMYGDLATGLKWDKSGDQYDLAITYHGSEAFGNVFLSSPEAVVTEGTSTSGTVTELGDVTVTDTNVAQVQAKNLIVVGGSCINAAAQKVLGATAASCGAAFTTLAGVGADQALIKVVKNPYLAADTTKIAMLVAGYEAADTTKAVKYLTTSKPSSAEGTIKLSTSGTVATVVTA